MLIEEAYRRSNDGTEWTVNVYRNLNNWEVSEYEDLLRLLASQHINSSQDTITWKLSKSKDFSIRSYYKHTIRNGQTRGHSFPTLQIWKSKVPPKIAFSAWEACRRCILIIDKLMTRGQTMINRCYLCKSAVESYNQILLLCPLAFELWSMVYWVSIGSWRSLLKRKFGLGMENVKKKNL